MNILCLTTEAFGGKGGIAQVTCNMVDAFAALPDVGHVYVTPLRGEALAAGDRARQSRGAASGIRFVANAVRDAVRTRPSLVYCNHLHLAPVASAIASAWRARFLLHLHGIEIWEKPSRARTLAMDRADLLLCVSRHTRRTALRLSPTASHRAVVLANMFDDDFTPGDRNAARRRFGLTDEYALLTVGRLDPLEQYKGHDRVIASLPLLRRLGRNIVYLIAGEGDDLPRIRKLAEDAGVADHVRFLGYVNRSSLPTLYSAADLFVLPSSGEGFGISFLEAMACGTPAMGIAVAGASDALGDGELGDCVAPEDFTEALLARVEASPPRREAVAQAVRARFGRPIFERRVAAILAMMEEGERGACRQ